MGNGEGSVAAAGGCCCVGLILFTCICGLPMIVAGVVLITLFDENIAGISLVSVAGFLIFGGGLLMVLMCSGIIGRKGYNPKKYNYSSTPLTPGGRAQQATTTTTTVTIGTPAPTVQLQPPPFRVGHRKAPGSPPHPPPYHMPQAHAQTPVQAQIHQQDAHVQYPTPASAYQPVPTVEPSAPCITEIHR